MLKLVIIDYFCCDLLSYHGSLLMLVQELTSVVLARPVVDLVVQDLVDRTAMVPVEQVVVVLAQLVADHLVMVEDLVMVDQVVGMEDPGLNVVVTLVTVVQVVTETHGQVVMGNLAQIVQAVLVILVVQVVQVVLATVLVVSERIKRQKSLSISHKVSLNISYI